MEKEIIKQAISNGQGMDFFTINEDGEIHVFASAYKGEDNGNGAWRLQEFSFFIEEVSEFNKHMEDNDNYVFDHAADLNQYIEDLTEEEMVNAAISFFGDGEEVNIMPINSADETTPCGNYISI